MLRARCRLEGFLTGGAECGFECTGHLVRNGTACDAAAAVVVSECGFGTELVSGECVACMVPTGGFLTGGLGVWFRVYWRSCEERGCV